MFESSATCEPEWLDDLDRSLGEPPEVAPLSDCEPSGWFALELDTATAAPQDLDDAALVSAIVGFDRVASWAAARQARLLAEFARRRPGDEPTAVMTERPSIGSRYAPDEIGLALGVSRGAAGYRLHQAGQLTSTLTETLELWERGRIDSGKVRAICDATWLLPTATAGAVQDRVLQRAPEQSLAQLRAALARAVIAADPQGAAERHWAARRERRVGVTAEPDGMASLWALLSAPAARSAYERLTRLARGLGAEDPRGMDARRADLLVDLLTGRPSIINRDGDTPATAPGLDQSPDQRIRPVAPGKPLIHVVVPFTVLTGGDDQPCELAGYGPIPADLAREIAADAVWKRLVTDPMTGDLLDHGRTTYHPPAALADFVRARDQHCRHPGCQRPAAHCELDHTIPYPHGPTNANNLWAGCAHHHRLKHHAGWRVTQRPDARIDWITPTGRRYTSRPHDYRAEPTPARPPPGHHAPPAGKIPPPPF